MRPGELLLAAQGQPCVLLLGAVGALPQKLYEVLSGWSCRQGLGAPLSLTLEAPSWAWQRAASDAGLALLWVDASAADDPRLVRALQLLRWLGVARVLLLVDGMERLAYQAEAFLRAQEALQSWGGEGGATRLEALPLSTTSGENLGEASRLMPWYVGPSLAQWLQSLAPLPRPAQPEEVYCLIEQGASASGPQSRVSGRLMRGALALGERLRCAHSGHQLRLESMAQAGRECRRAVAGTPLLLGLGPAAAVDQGEVLTPATRPLQCSDHFEVGLHWLGAEPGLVGRRYDLLMAGQPATASLTAIKYRFEPGSEAQQACRELAPGEFAVGNLASSRALAFAPFEQDRLLGSFLLCDPAGGEPLALGLIHHSLRRAQNVHRQALTIDRAAREALNGHAGRVVWFTGLSGSGKSTLANALAVRLHAAGRHCYILDGDNIRHGLNKDLGFTEADRVENIRRVAEVAKLMMDAGLIVLSAFISPFRREREMARDLIGPAHFSEVYVSTPLPVCEARDVKGLYRKARSGQLPNMTGIDSPYEAPERADWVLDCSQGDIDEQVVRLIEALGL